MIELINIGLYLLAALLGIAAMWSTRESRCLFAATFMSSASCAFSAALYMGSIGEGVIDPFEGGAIGAGALWAAHHAVKALLFSFFHLYTMRTGGRANAAHH